MKEDLTQLKFFIIKHNQIIVKDPSNKRMNQMTYKMDQKYFQSMKLTKAIKK